ncbi:MAG: DegV family protein, partial [Lachnospiraceae bacterium]|nr:DegV family protein [Lachnospiraceae bacterium]
SDKKIFVIDSESASCGESQIALRAMELEEQGKSFEEITKELEEYRDAMKTYFVLDNIETLRKNGRMSGVKALVATTLNIKPVLASDKGSIVQAGQAIGIKKALMKMIEIIVKEAQNIKDKRIMITHCNNPQKAEWVKNALAEKTGSDNIVIMPTSGLSSLYANDGGIIVTY